MAATSVKLAEIQPAAKTVRVLHVIPGEDSPNNFIFARRQVESLQNAGVGIETFFLKSRTSPVAVFKEWARLRKKVRAFAPAILHSQYGTVTAVLCGMAGNLPLVVTFRGSDLNPIPSIHPVKAMLGHMFSQLAALRASHLICVTPQMQQRLWWGRGRASVLSGGVNLKLFYPRSRENTRTLLGWPLRQAVVLFNAGKEPQIKRLDLAERAVEAARKMYGEFRFEVMRGDISPDRVPLYMNAADCLLVTSDYEGSPYIVKEAIACNLPVVSVDVGDIQQQLEPVAPSRIVLSRDAEDLGRAVTEILKLQQRSNGWEHIQQFSQEREAGKIVAIYEQVLGNGSGRKIIS